MTDQVDEAEELEVLIEDDTPEKDRGRPVAPEAPVPEGDDDADLDDDVLFDSLGPKVKKRIDKLTAEKHAERRAKEAVVRERDEAVRVAQEAFRQTQALKNQTSQYEQGFVYQAKTAADSEIDAATHAYRQAFEANDVQSMLDANKRLTKAQVDKSRYDGYVAPQVEQVPPPQAQPQAAPQLTPQELSRQTKFIRANPWLNRDEEMTTRALEIDQYVRSNAPHIVGSDEYYEFVDTMMRQQFPEDRFQSSVAKDSPPRRAPNGVAPVNRGVSPKPRSITLTQSQVRLCKKLGITPQQYAAQLLKDQANA